MTYWETAGWTLIVACFVLMAAVIIDRQLQDPGFLLWMAKFLAPIAAFFAICALVAVPIWLLT